MSELFELILFYAVLLDSVFANIVAWNFSSWFSKSYPGLARHLPLTKAWAFVYLCLVLWIGCALLRLNILPY